MQEVVTVPVLAVALDVGAAATVVSTGSPQAGIVMARATSRAVSPATAIARTRC